MRRHLFFIVLLSAVLLLLLDRATDESSEPDDAAATAAAPDYDYVLSGADSTSFRADGQPRYRLRAERLTHYPQPDHSDVEAPDLEIYPEGKLPWTITARQGRIVHAAAGSAGPAERVDLRQDVHVRHENAAGRPLDIFTEFLQIWPDERRAASDLQVRSETPGAWLTGLGMRADLENNSVQLLENVQGSYAP